MVLVSGTGLCSLFQGLVLDLVSGTGLWSLFQGLVCGPCFRDWSLVLVSGIGP